MKIEIEISDIELFAKALNNAFIAYSDIVSCINVLGIEPQLSTVRYVPLMKLSTEELDARYNELKQVYLQVEDIERRMLNDQRRENHEPFA